MKVAVASSDGIVINTHFGRADTFYIYETRKDAKEQLLEVRKGKPFCHGGEHEDSDLLDAVRLLADCEKIYVLQIGYGAEKELREHGITPIVARGMIEEIISE